LNKRVLKGISPDVRAFTGILHSPTSPKNRGSDELWHFPFPWENARMTKARSQTGFNAKTRRRRGQRAEGGGPVLPHPCPLRNVQIFPPRTLTRPAATLSRPASEGSAERESSSDGLERRFSIRVRSRNSRPFKAFLEILRLFKTF
jgi:hypothetical protein